MSSHDWLCLVQHAAGTFIHHNRCLSHVREQLISPQTQFPALTLFLGKGHKDVALRYVFPDNQITPGRSGLRLRLENRTLYGDHPILIADCDSHLTPLAPEPVDGEREEIPIFWNIAADRNHLDILLSRLLFLFVDVVCIFADDVGGLDAVRAELTRWAALGRNVSSLDHRPRVLVVADSNGASVTQDILEESDFLFQLLRSPDVPEVFATPNLLQLRTGNLSGAARFLELKDELLKALDLSRRDRRQDGLLFSAAHMDEYFNHALHHVCRTPQQPFDFVRSSKRNAGRDMDHSFHLKEFLGLTSVQEWEYQAAYIASTLLVDAYRPGSHFFNPAAIFDSFYRESCQAAITAVGMAPSNCQLIEFYLARFHKRLQLGQGPSRRIHKTNLVQWQNLLVGIRTAGFGHPVEGAEYQYHIDCCVLCQSPSINVINVLPCTAPVRAITIDGGGVRGFIPLRFLQHIQLQLGAQFPVQDLVDVAFGTSSVFRQRRSVDECNDTFADLMQEFFQKQPPPRSIWAKLLRAIRCWWTDGWYDASMWDKLLQSQFDASQQMFDTQPVSGTKVAVTTTARDTVLLTNYRRNTVKPDDGAYYRVHEPTDATEEPMLWQCARATTAAPICEDGGLKENNPALICRSETRFMWPSRLEPGTLISLGTGSANVGHPPGLGLARRRRSKKRGFAFRVYDFFMASMDAKEAWKKFLGQLDEATKRNYHRLDVTFPSQEPRLNSAGEVRWMTSLVDKEARIQVPPALTSLLLASLFFELSSVPQWEDGFYHCIGTIRCRVRGNIFVDALTKLHPHASAFILGEETLGISPYSDAVCEMCRRYCVPVRFAVKELHSRITLSLRLDGEQAQPLGGFPLSLCWFLEQQELYWSNTQDKVHWIVNKDGTLF
ncbi:hypothetical protein EYZ11_010621 [Aspergillus tanneri]|uniref:PNPLA domain-containing protein n=1 Tax=Aspergillus tanneri TaxID=1220188 RepID=A0A4V3UN61_9EURO|nr:hypothetical protein EYZ11_010621 [Aspergillus tanneri]